MNTLHNVRKAPVAKAMGIEIELICRKEYIPDWCGFFYKGRDGSIDCLWREHGYEFVSQPLTYEWMQRELKKLYKLLDSLDYYENTTCGLHIHVSKKWFSDKKAKAVWKFIKAMPKADYVDLFGREPNYFCRNTEDYAGCRYHAINMSNSATNEFRMFKSGDLAWALYCVDCVKYMVDNAYTLNVSAFSAFRDQRKYRGLST